MLPKGTAKVTLKRYKLSRYIKAKKISNVGKRTLVQDIDTGEEHFVDCLLQQIKAIDFEKQIFIYEVYDEI